MRRLERPTVETVKAEPVVDYSWTSDYLVAERVELPSWVNPSEAGSGLHMVRAIEAIASAEGPVHMDLVEERLRDWWDIGRIGAKIRENVNLAVKRSDVHREGPFLRVRDRPIDQVRRPAGGVARKAEQVHVSELALAIRYLVRDAGAVSRADVVTHVARLFGWARTGDIVSRVINSAIEAALDRGLVESDGDSLKVAAQ